MRVIIERSEKKRPDVRYPLIARWKGPVYTDYVVFFKERYASIVISGKENVKTWPDLEAFPEDWEVLPHGTKVTLVQEIE